LRKQSDKRNLKIIAGAQVVLFFPRLPRGRHLRILKLAQIKTVLEQIGPGTIQRAIEQGFADYSQGKVVVPPVGEMLFENPPGETHIKYGYIRGDDYFVIKIASGFYDNARIGLPTSSGLMLLFSQKTGELISVLLDDSYLTQVRTAIAGAIVADHFAPRQVRCAGIFGAGVQGRMQLQYLRGVRTFERVIVCGLNDDELQSYQSDMAAEGFRVDTTLDPSVIADRCNLIVTATPSCKPLLAADQVQKGTHITAMGSDTPEKQELDPAILQKADRVIVDSLSQAMHRGEAYHAMKSGAIHRSRLIELGAAILDPTLRRQSDEEITVADLTGVAVQDIQISKAVWQALNG
jgi:ornithine cyclodeaminase